MNIATLKKNSERTREELQEMGRKGGIASGKSKRAKKECREILTELLKLPFKDVSISNGNKLQEMIQQGMDKKSITQYTAVLWAVVDSAQRGNLSATKLIFRIMDDLPENTASDDDAF